MRRSHAATASDRHLLQARCKGQCAVLRSQAGFRDAMDEDTVDLRPSHQPALHTKQRPLRPQHLADFIACYNPDDRLKRTETEQFRPFTYDELVARDKVSLDIIWLQDESLEDSEN